MGASYGGQNGSETIQRSITRWPITDETENTLGGGGMDTENPADFLTKWVPKAKLKMSRPCFHKPYAVPIS